MAVTWQLAGLSYGQPVVLFITYVVHSLTFGNVGKEPALCWDKSISLLRWLAERRHSIKRLRFGLVTNTIRLNERKAADVAALNPDYLDISLDGVGDTHDAIRSKGSYRRTTRNIATLLPELREKVFISFTANEWNASSLPALVRFASATTALSAIATICFSATIHSVLLGMFMK